MNAFFVLVAVIFLCAHTAQAQYNPPTPVQVGSTTFPLGDAGGVNGGAFPVEAECTSTCNVSNLAIEPDLINFIGPLEALTSRNPYFVVINASHQATWLLTFGEPIAPDPAGPDFYLGQAEFLVGGDGLRSTPALNTIEWRVGGGTGAWQSVPASAFTLDSTYGTAPIFYADPEVKSDAYRLWTAKVELGTLPPGFGSTSSIEIRANDNTAPSNEGTDLVLFGNLNLSCGDVNANGQVTAADSQAINVWLNGGAAPLRLDLCDVGGISACTATDSLIINRAVINLSPGIQQVCRGEAL